VRDKIFAAGKKLVQHELITGSFYIFAGSIFANFLAFLLNLFLVRNLSYVDYGIFASLLSIITLASISGGSINTILVRFASDYHSRNQLGKLRSFYKKSFKIVFLFSFLISLSFVIFSPLIKDFLHLDNIFYVFVAGLCVAAGYIQILNTGFLQGLVKFKFLAFVSGFSGVIKLIAGIILVFLGFRAFSGLWAIVLMGLGAFIIALIPLKFIFSKNTDNEVHIPTKEILQHALPIFIAVLFMTSFTSTDVVLVKHFFNPPQAAFYAGLSLIGKVIFYFTIPIPTVMLPLLIRRHNLGLNFNNLFYLALLLVLIPSISITGFYFLFPKFVVNLFLGGRGYLAIAGLVGFFGINLTIFSLINVCVNFFLSLNKIRIAPLIVVAALAQIILIYIFHSNFYQIVVISMVVSASLLTVLLFIFFKNYAGVARIKKNITFLNASAID
jgi:O-antigen/teichoic acid export membrane protein